MDSLPASGPVSPGVRTRPLVLSAVLLMGLGPALAAAPQGSPPTDPFLRTAPAAQPTTLSGLPAAGTASSRFGVPRFSSTGGTTRVVLDLPPGLRYSLTPTFSGLRLDVQPTPGQMQTLAAQHVNLPGSAVSDYTLTPDPSGGGQLLLQTPFPLGGTQGWTAAETTIASGGRVLILTLGAALTGGADASVSGTVQAIASPSVAGAATSPTGTLLPVPAAGSSAVAGPPAPTGAADQLPPGDSPSPANSGALPTSTPPLVGSTDTTHLTLGVVDGTLSGLPLLAAPRLGRNPGLTRVVLDLPAGTGFRITPLPLGLRIDLTGVKAGALSSPSNLSPEVLAWSFAPNLTGTSLTLLTSAPMTLRSGWRDVLLPAQGAQLARLAIDVSPALADTSPMGALALAPL